ncbi:MAG TPA: hypothetical protein VIL65_13810 [Beijerinckiaceae bacterium]|jgi:hypothetical protein
MTSYGRVTARLAGHLATVLALLLVPGAALAQTTAACQHDLAAVDVSFKRTMERLTAAESADQSGKCVAWRQHVETMQAGVTVFNRCLTGHAQRENVLQLLVSIDDFEGLLKRKCS